MPQTDAVTAFVSLGSNLGDAHAHLAFAREALAALPGVRLHSVSPLYRTEPQGLHGQPFFLNQVASLRTLCDPLPLLEALLDIEKARGRVRGVRFGPRVLDLDLLLFGNVCMDNERLTLPHPRMLERAFVLAPLADLAPDFFLPQGMTVREALERIPFTRVGGTIYQTG